MESRRKPSLLDIVISPVRRENLLAQVEAGLLMPLRGTIQHTILDPVHQHLLPRFQRHVLAPLDAVLAPLEALANRVADGTAGADGAGASGAGFRMPPFDPDSTGLSFNEKEARRLVDRLRDELGDNMPLDRQNPDQNPEPGGSGGGGGGGNSGGSGGLSWAAGGFGTGREARAREEEEEKEEEEEDRVWRRERKFEDFAPVLAQIDFDAIPRVVEDVSVLLGLSAKYRGPARLGEAIFGTMVVCYPIIWDGDEDNNNEENAENGSEVASVGERRRSRVSKTEKRGEDVDADRGKKKWIIKFPINGDHKAWKVSDARALASEVGTMRWLKRQLGVHTRLNIPRVYHWDAGGDVDVDEQGRPISNQETGLVTKKKASSSASASSSSSSSSPPSTLSSDGSKTSRTNGPNRQAQNPIGAPFILMQHVEGTTAHDAWFTHWGRRAWWRPEADAARRAILAHVALAVSELGRFALAAGGAPVFRLRDEARSHGRNRREDLVAVGPARVLDVEAMLDRWQCRLSAAVAAREVRGGGGGGGGGGSSGYDGENGAFAKADRKGKGPAFYCERTPLYRELGPWEGEDAEERFYTSRMDCHYVREDSDFGGTMMLRGYWKWFRDGERELGLASKRGRSVGSKNERGEDKGKFISPHDEDDNEDDETHPFVLAHPDLSLHSIIIDTRGKFYFLGWSGVQAVPRAVGHEALPTWLCRDWNPFAHRWRDADWPWRYRHNSAAGTPWAVPVPDRNLAEEPSWKLAEWRAYYAECVTAARTAWRCLEDEKREAYWRRWEAKEEERRQVRGREGADEPDALERVRENLFATRAGSSTGSKRHGSEKISATRVEEEAVEEPRGRTRYRPGSESPSADRSPVHKTRKTPERHVSFAAGAKPEAAPAPRPPLTRPRRKATTTSSQPLSSLPSRLATSPQFPLLSTSSSCSTTAPPPEPSRTLLSILPLTLLAASGDPRARPFILQELFHRAEPSAPRWENVEVARLRRGALNSCGGGGGGRSRETVPRPYEIESAAAFRRLLRACAGVAGQASDAGDGEWLGGR